MDDTEMASYIVNALEIVDPDEGLPRIGCTVREPDSNTIRAIMSDGSEFRVVVERA